jgi:hypothetical protein
MDLEIAALSWAPARFRAVEPPTEEYGRRACEAGRGLWQRYHDYLAERGMTDAHSLIEIAFLETVGDERDGPSIALAGFYSHGTPYRIYIVVDKAPLDEVAWWVRHEVAHAIQYLLVGAASKGPRGEALADEVAGPDVPAGHAEWQALTADRLVMLPPSWLAAEILPAIGAGDETLALPAWATGITVTGGSISVANPTGTVIIDGTSDILKVAVNDYVSSASGPNVTTMVLTATYATGLTAAPAHQGYAGFAYGQLPYMVTGIGGGSVIVYDLIQLHTEVVSTNQTKVSVAYKSGLDRTATAWSTHYFIFKEAML